MEKLIVPELTTDQIETLCTTAENAARKHVLARVPSKMVERLNISVEAEGAKPLSLTVEIDMALSPRLKGFNAEAFVKEAVQEAHKASEKYLRKLK